MTDFFPVSDTRFAVAEGPVWDVATQCLFWVDIIGRTIHARQMSSHSGAQAGREEQVWHCDDFPTALALSKSHDRALVALASGLAWLDFETGTFTPFATPDTMPGNRLNEGKCDPQGRFWTGSMQTNLNADGSGKDMDRNSGALFRVDADGSTSRHSEHEFGIANTLAWSPDGKTLYFGDSVRNVIFAYDWHGEEGKVSNRRIHLEGFGRGAPDGSAIDEDGCLWNARFGGSCLIRITPQGKVDQVFELPVTNPTSCTFGGTDRKTLFVTSAQFTLSHEQLAANSVEGAVFQASTGVQAQSIPVLEPEMSDPLLLGRVWRADSSPVAGPAVIVVRDGDVVDITSSHAPTVRDVCELDDPIGYVSGAEGETLGSLEAIMAAPIGDLSKTHLLAPCDLQAVKACGVTFAGSMVERVIEERAAGDPSAAETIRNRIGGLIGDSLRNITPGSGEAMKVKKALMAEGLWSQYLEVGIGPDAEVFSKSQVLSSVGHGAKVGLHPASKWNNPEPEVVLAVASTGAILGASLGNDVNLRDIEGRSALLLSKAKDNNASCSIGPFIRLFDEAFTLDDVRKAELTLRVEGPDGFVLEGRSDMGQISRDPADLVSQTLGPHHQYPDGIMLFLGTLFAPTQDRDAEKAPGEGFTHKLGDVVTIASPDLGALTNTVDLSTNCPPWTFGTRALMANLAARNLL